MKFDIVGVRVRNLSGIEQFERKGIYILRYVWKVIILKHRQLKLYIWKENDGSSVYWMHEALPVDVYHSVFLSRTEVLWQHRCSI